MTLLAWADDIRRLGVWANADYPEDAERARRYGAKGIGLCRTEHMFFQEERLPIVQDMITAGSKARRVTALERSAAHAAQRLRGHLQRHGRLPRHHPPAGPAAA